MLDDLNKKINTSHNNHYINNVCSLIKVDEAPNDNIIYHFYNDGEITNQKGGFAYKLRSEFTYKPRLLSVNNSILKLPITIKNDISYAILTKEECDYYYNKLKNIVELLELV